MKALTAAAAVAGIVGTLFTVLQYTKSGEAQGVNKQAIIAAPSNAEATVTVAQNGSCNNLNVAPGASVNCSNNTGGGNTFGQAVPQHTAPIGAGWRTRFGTPIPPCGPGQGYSIDEGRCMARQYIGGVIPCSQDDVTFEGGRYVNNCH